MSNPFGFKGGKGKGKGRKGSKGLGIVWGPNGETYRNSNRLFDPVAQRERKEKLAIYEGAPKKRKPKNRTKGKPELLRRVARWRVRV